MSYLNNKIVKDALARARKVKEDGLIISDIIDDEGHQYVDLVQEGGGVLGIALVGYCMVLEEAGVRFFSLAGTSAGAINTLAMASVGKMEEAKGQKLLKILDEQDLFEFVDGPKFVQRFIRTFIEKSPGSWIWYILSALRLAGRLRKYLGLNPGLAFEKWLKRLLKENGIGTTADLENHRSQLPKGLRHRDGRPMKFDARLAVITSDITTKSKIAFPEMADLYWKDPQSESPASYVRASMSIPGFFHPYTVENIPQGEAAKKRWVDRVDYRAESLPQTVRFVDGGLLSNFPINVFHKKGSGEPTRPTLGARLSAHRQKENETDTLGGFAGALVSTMRHIYDYEFILKNKDFVQLICRIDADLEFEWLDFSMAPDKKVELFAHGAERAIEWLEGWHNETDKWENYKKMRVDNQAS